jgi:hypothetical protein
MYPCAQGHICNNVYLWTRIHLKWESLKMLKLCAFMFLTMLPLGTDCSSRDSSSNEREYLIGSDGNRYDLGNSLELKVRGDDDCCSPWTGCCSDDYQENYQAPKEECSLTVCLFELFCLPCMPFLWEE